MTSEKKRSQKREEVGRSQCKATDKENRDPNTDEKLKKKKIEKRKVGMSILNAKEKSYT